MTITVKYAVEPVYEKIEKEQTKLLYGYIVSKCYKLEGCNGNIVLFPYVVNKKTYALQERRFPKSAVVGFNTTSVDDVYSNYFVAKTACNEKNQEVALGRNKHWYDALQELENIVSSYTADMKINEKKSIKIKKL